MAKIWLKIRRSWNRPINLMVKHNRNNLKKMNYNKKRKILIWILFLMDLVVFFHFQVTMYFIDYK
jgi:hypothetical protein